MVFSFATEDIDRAYIVLMKHLNFFVLFILSFDEELILLIWSLLERYVVIAINSLVLVALMVQVKILFYCLK